jgi:putative oxidoreductase
VNLALPGSARDVALLVARLLLGTIMFAHGYQKLVLDGLGRTSQGFESMSIPVAIFSAAFVTVVEIVGGVLVILGALLTLVAGCYLVVMVGAAVFVHVSHGIFVENGGWELVGAITALLLALAAAGSGRYGVDGLLRERHVRAAAQAPTEVHPVPAFTERPPVRPDYVARAAAFTEVFPQVTEDAAAPPLPVRRPSATRWAARRHSTSAPPPDAED